MERKDFFLNYSVKSNKIAVIFCLKYFVPCYAKVQGRKMQLFLWIPTHSAVHGFSLGRKVFSLAESSLYLSFTL